MARPCRNVQHLWFYYWGCRFDALDLLYGLETLDGPGRQLGVLESFDRLWFDVAWGGVRGPVPNPFMPWPF